ncbi:hypothetical protein SBV1_2780009 [Verrucomicrobia bacterium]|nr:hypothetical protein SBV1_2780009 [Verrucomicrobiota bacterium]
MAKRRDSAYHAGRRSDAWLKIKSRQTVECAIIGYTKGEGDRQETFGALHLAQRRDGDMKYIGKVGSGFDERLLRDVWSEISGLTKVKRPVIVPTNDSRSVWVEPQVVCEVQFASETQEGLLREPVFVRLRPDLTAT